MGMFKDLKKLTEQSKEIQNDWDPGQQARDATEQMKALNQQMAAATAAMNAPPSEGGIDATATIVSVGQTAGMMNMDPIMPIEFLVQQPGMPPRPMSATAVVPMAHIAKVSSGATVPVKVGGTDPNAIAIDWAKL